MVSPVGMLEGRAEEVTSYYVELVFDMGGPLHADDDDLLDGVAEAFADLADVDGDVGADSHTGRVDLCMTLDAADRPEALRLAFIAARTAVHAAGGATPGWERLLEQLLAEDRYRSSVTPSALV